MTEAPSEHESLPHAQGSVGKLGAGLLILALGGLGLALSRNWAAVRQDLALVGMWQLVSSFLAAGCATLLTGSAWRVIVGGLGYPVPLGPAARLFTAAQLGKYLPGSVWVAAIQAELGRPLRVPRPVSVLSYLIAVLISVASGSMIGLIAVAGSNVQSSGLFWIAAAVAVAALGLLIFPMPINAALRWTATRMKRPLPDVALSGRTLATAFALSSVGWLCFGVHAWVLATAFGVGLGDLPIVTGAFALAYVAGLLLVPLPAGAGVREGVLVAFLSPSIGPVSALAVALISRLILALTDLILAAGFRFRVRAGVGS